MSGRTRLWLGTVLLTLAIGLLIGGLVRPRPAIGQEPGEAGEGRFAFTAGIRGSARHTQTLYVIDDAADIFHVFEYSAAAGRFEHRTAVDLRRLASELGKARAKARPGE